MVARVRASFLLAAEEHSTCGWTTVCLSVRLFDEHEGRFSLLSAVHTLCKYLLETLVRPFGVNTQERDCWVTRSLPI